MRPDAGDQAYLHDMIEACERIARFVTDRTLADYRSDDLLRSGVERQIEVVGEAARRLSNALREAHPEVPWRPIIAQRHILAHEYGDVEDELIWRVATVHVPALVVQLRTLRDPPADASG